MKILASSLMRNLPLGDVHVTRVAAELPLFRVGKEGLYEEWIDPDVSERAAPIPQLLPARYIDSSQYSWVFFIGDGSIVLRELDHLLDVDSDILWAPMASIPLRSERYGGYLTEEEWLVDRVDHPWSRPWTEAASPEVWAVRGECYAQVVEHWRRISSLPPLQPCSDPTGSAWNRLLFDTDFRTSRFERGEIAFPALEGASYSDWCESAILNVGEWEPEMRSKFLQAQFFGTFFGDESGLFLDLLEP